MQVKTITTAAGVNEIDFGNDGSQSTAHFYWLKNLGDSTLYVSANPNPIAEKDDVAELPAKGAVSVETDEGKIYILGAGKVEIHRTNSKFCPFDWQSSGSSGGGGGSITVDSELSDTSTNPLQNKVTTAAINEVKSDLAKTQEDVAENAAALSAKSDINHTHDITASGNPVTLDSLQGDVPFSEMVVSGKNLLTYPYNETTKTVNGITFTDNGDGTITVNGTATANATFRIDKNFGFEKEGNYFLSGCPSGGGLNSFYINWYQNHTGVTTKNYNDYGSGINIPYQHIFSENNSLAISIIAGATVENLVFRPQIELGDTATTYEPPIMGRELTISASGKNLISGNIIKRTATVTDNSDSWIIEWTAAMFVRFDKIFLKPNTDYTISWWQKSDNGTDCVRIGVINGDNESSIIEQSSAEIKTGTEYTLCSFTFNSGNNRNIYVQFLRASVTGTVYVKKSIQLELGDTATEYEPYHGAEYAITPTSNPYTISDDISQQEGYNVISISEGELSVVGVQKNAAIKRIWDEIGMDLLFDGTVTTGTNCITENINGYNFLYFYGNLSSVSGESGNVTGSLVIPKTARAISAGQSVVVTTGVIYITVNIINIESGVITFTVTPSDSNREIHEFKVFGIK